MINIYVFKTDYAYRLIYKLSDIPYSRTFNAHRFIYKRPMFNYSETCNVYKFRS